MKIVGGRRINNQGAVRKLIQFYCPMNYSNFVERFCAEKNLTKTDFLVGAIEEKYKESKRGAIH